jgi:hypothetical protein
MALTYPHIFGKLEAAGYIVRLQSLHNLHIVGMDVKAVMSDPSNIPLPYT